MYIDDAVNAVFQLYRHAKKESDSCTQIVNIASKDTRPLRSFVEEIKEIVGERGTLEYGTFVQAKEGALSIQPVIDRLLALTVGDYTEAFSFADGIRAIIRKEEECGR